MPTIACRTVLPFFVLMGVTCCFKAAGQVSSPANTPTPFRVSGMVTSQETGVALQGVNVLVKGAATGSITDEKGNYSISAPNSNATLIFSYVGYKSEERKLENRSTLNVSLSNDAKSLSDVVVVGYGTQRKRDITGSVGSVSAKQIEDLPVTGLDQALAGQISGVQVSQTTGAPGGGVTIRVRGTGSIGAGNEPLYVIDGFPVEGNYSQFQNPLNTINPNDIESIEVLKDASAQAIYGSRGSNGVVLITTKKGKQGKAKFDFEVYTGWQQVAHKVEMMNAREHVELVVEAKTNSWLELNPNNKATDPMSVRPLALQFSESFRNAASFGEGTDWQDEVFRTAPMSNYQLTVSGGSENIHYLISAGYFNQDGIIINSGFERFASRINVDANVSKKLKVGVNLAPSYTNSNVVPAEGDAGDDGIISNLFAYSPVYPVYNPDGSYTTQIRSDFSNAENPVNIARSVTDQRSRIRLLGNIFAEFEIIKGLNFRSSVGSDINASRLTYFRPSTVGRGGTPAPVAAFGQSGTAQSINWLNENTLTYIKSFHKNHNITALLGYTIQKETIETNSIDATNFPNDFVQTLNAGQVTAGSSNTSEWSLISYLSRVQYDYKGKYLAAATMRRDGSSRFGSENKWGLFPSASVGWRISEENFMTKKFFNAISDLKLRASYGFSGNNTIGNYSSLALLSRSNYSTGAGLGTFTNGLSVSNLLNNELTWENSKQFDVGLDFGLLNDRIYVVADYYTKITSDLLLDVPVPTLTGFSRSLQNIGKVKNWGWEFSVSTKNLVNQFKWSTNANISFNKNKVLALGPAGDPIRSGGQNLNHITQIGAPIGSFFGYTVEGIYQTQQDVEKSASVRGNGASRPGDFRFRDTNADGEITVADQTIIGDAFPDFTYGLTNTFSYKNFDLNILIQGVQGNEVFFISRRSSGDFQGGRNQFKELVNRWRSPQQPGNGRLPRAARTTTGQNTASSTYFIEDGSYLRVRNITMAYNFPPELSNRFLRSARLYLGVQNAFTFTDYYGYNPEVSVNGADPLQPGRDYGGYPVSRIYTIGLNVGF